MKINYQPYNHFNFKSINHPIKDFQLKTKDDCVKVKEMKLNKVYPRKTLEKTFSFFIDNFANQSSDPDWSYYRKNAPEFNQLAYNWYLDSVINGDFYYRSDSLDTTILVGKNKDKKVVAGIMTYPFEEENIIKNKKTLYVEMLAVDKDYRNNRIATQLLDKVIEKTKEIYDNVFLVAYKESVPFYEKIGFKPLPQKGHKRFINKLAQERSDYPQYVSFLIKKIAK